MNNTDRMPMLLPSLSLHAKGRGQNVCVCVYMYNHRCMHMHTHTYINNIYSIIFCEGSISAVRGFCLKQWSVMFSLKKWLLSSTKPVKIILPRTWAVRTEKCKKALWFKKKKVEPAWKTGISCVWLSQSEWEQMET